MFEKNKNEEKRYLSIIAGALIINNEGKIFLFRNESFENKYNTVGGHIENYGKLGESIKETLKNKVKKETNLSIDIIEPFSFRETIFPKQYTKKEHIVLINYLCRYKGDGSELKLYNKFNGPVWFSPEEAVELDLAIGIEELIKKYIDYLRNKDNLEGWKRCQADFENYRKRQDESRKQLKEFILEDLALQIMPVVDNFEMSLSHIPENQSGGAWVQGILHIQRQLETILKDNGISEIEVKEGDVFNPEIHEAVENHQEEEKEEQHKIKKVISKGYKIGEKVIRAAKVIVE